MGGRSTRPVRTGPPPPWAQLRTAGATPGRAVVGIVAAGPASTYATIATNPKLHRPLDSLAERELEVARLVVDRKTNPEIAADLFLSQKTVETHLRNIFNKTGVESRVALARAIERADAGAPAASEVRSTLP